MNNHNRSWPSADRSRRRSQLRKTIDNFRQAITTRHRIAELLVFAWLLPVGGLVMFPANPTGLQSGFPWVIVGPIVFAARYGSSWGVLCGLLTGTLLLMPLQAYTSLTVNLTVLVIGMLLISAVVGDAATGWRKKSRAYDAENQYLRHRLKEFSADYHVLKVSHGLLEEHMAGQRLSLREALQQVKALLKSSPEDTRVGTELMAIFSHFCSIQVAGLYAMLDGKTVNQKPMATHGHMVELPLFDPLLKAAIETREVASIRLNVLAEKPLENGLLAVVPLIGSDEKLHGILAIKDMHFMAFQQQNLNLLALLGHYIGNQLSRTHSAALTQFDFFMTELKTALKFAHAKDTQSVLLCLRFAPHPDADSIAEYVNQSIRSLDTSLILTGDRKTPVLSLLLPLMSESKSIEFMHRVNAATIEQFGIALEDVVDSTTMYELDSDASIESCLAQLCDAAGPAAVELAMTGKMVVQEHSDAA